MLKTKALQWPTATHQTPTPSQAFVTTPSPRCSEKVVTKRGRGVGGRSRLKIIEIKKHKKIHLVRKKPTKYKVRGESQKKNKVKNKVSVVIDGCTFQLKVKRQDFSPLTSYFKGINESLWDSPVSSTQKAVLFAIRTPARYSNAPDVKLCFTMPSHRMTSSTSNTGSTSCCPKIFFSKPNGGAYLCH